MSNVLISSQGGAIPTTTHLGSEQVAINTKDGKIFVNANGTIIELLGTVVPVRSWTPTTWSWDTEYQNTKDYEMVICVSVSHGDSHRWSYIEVDGVVMARHDSGSFTSHGLIIPYTITVPAGSTYKFMRQGSQVVFSEANVLR